MSDPLELLKARYGFNADLPFTLPDAFNPVLETLLAHRSVRAFLREPLAPDTLELLISAAQSAPSSSNLQVWSVIAVEDEQRKQRIAGYVGDQKHVLEAPLFLAWLVDLSRLQRIADAAGESIEGLRYLDTFLMGVIDAALAAQNVVTAAESLGLGAVYIGALRNQPEKIAAEFNITEGVFPVFGLCIGRPDASRPAVIKPRLPQRSVLYREQYTPAPIQEEVGFYDETMKAFYASQNLPVDKWSEHSIARLRGPENLKGRDRLKQALGGLGFELL